MQISKKGERVSFGQIQIKWKSQEYAQITQKKREFILQIYNTGLYSEVNTMIILVFVLQ